MVRAACSVTLAFLYVGLMPVIVLARLLGGLFRSPDRRVMSRKPTPSVIGPWPPKRRNKFLPSQPHGGLFGISTTKKRRSYNRHNKMPHIRL